MTDTGTPETPRGQLILRTMAMPADTNANGDIFGGWILSQMDIAGAIRAQEVADGRVVTVAVDGMKFLRPVKIGDVVSCYGELDRVGTTSIGMRLETWVKPVLRPDACPDTQLKVTEATFTYVAIDEHGNKRPVPEVTGG